MAGRVFIDQEPCSVCAEDAIEMLERIGWAKCANIVRNLNSKNSWTRMEADRLKAQLEEALTRLYRYEPPAPRKETPTYRSQWD